MMPWEVTTVGIVRPIEPGEARKLPFTRPEAFYCLGPGTPLGKILGAAIFADGSFAGDGRVVRRILKRRKLACH